MEKAFLSFLNNSLPYAALCAKKVEENFFINSSNALAKASLYIEDVIRKVWEMGDVEGYKYSSLHEKINFLYDQGHIPTKIYQSFDIIQRAVNMESSHSIYNATKIYSVHKEMHNIAVWYVDMYANEHLIIPMYVEPQSQEVEKIEESRPSSYHKHKLELLNNSYLEREIARLKISSAEAVENAQSFSNFKSYLHVTRPIQKTIEQVLEQRKQQSGSNLILLCGSVGDGKSHLLAYLNRERKDLIDGYTIYNDATESFSPDKTYLETLEGILKDFSDQHFGEAQEKVIIAINLGVLHNFINYDHPTYTYNKLKQFVEQSGLFTPKILTHAADTVFDLVSFADYQIFELTDSGVESNYLLDIIKKVCNESEENPFYMAYLKDLEENRHTIIHENYKFLSDEFVQKQIVKIVVEAIIQYKINLSSRHYLNFIADLIIPSETETVDYVKLNEYEQLTKSLPYMLFHSQGRSQLLDTIGQLNPIHFRISAIDELLVTLNTLSDWEELLNQNIRVECAKKWVSPFAKEAELIKEAFDLFVENLIAILYLTDVNFAKNIQNSTYNKYIEYVYAFNKKRIPKVKEFYREFKDAIFSWKGSPLTEYINLERLEGEKTIAQKITLMPVTDYMESLPGEKLQSFKPFITVVYAEDDTKSNCVTIDIDFSLYQLLTKVIDGYRPNKKDEEDATTFVEFLDKIMLFGEQQKELLVNFIAENMKYKLTQDEFGEYVFKKVE